jgi:RNA polymerase sigma-70 factor (ECF subfamily)
LREFHLFYAARADLLRRAGRFAEAKSDYERALGLAGNAPEQRYLAKRTNEMRGLVAGGQS